MVIDSHPVNAKVGVLLTRLVVPAWVLVGAGLKLAEINPDTLPGHTVAAAVEALPVAPTYVLAAIVSLEFLAAALMLTLAGLARPLALGVLGVYCAILFGEMAQGNMAASGCLGAHSLPPLVMLVINGILILAVLVFDPTAVIRVGAPNLARAAAVTLAMAGFAMSFKVVIDAERANGAGPFMAESKEREGGDDSAPLQLNLVSPAGSQRVASPSRQ